MRRAAQRKQRKKSRAPKGAASREASSSPNSVDAIPASDDAKKNAKDPTEEAINKSIKIWSALKDLVKATPDYVNLPDEDKSKMFRDRWPDFHRDFPIVSKYMCCMGQFSIAAFRKFLDASSKTVQKAAADREKGYMEDQWIRRQADYVKFLWVAYQKGHYSARDSMAVWKQAYDSLKGEFLQFREMHDKAESAVEQHESASAKELTKELLARVLSGEQDLPPDEMRKLIEILKAAKAKQDSDDDGA